MRSIWTGAIGFGLVNIPIKVYSATQGSDLDLDMLDRRDMGKIRFKRVNENTDREVKWEDIVKGYLYNDEYVVLDDKDFEAASPEKSKVIEITDFVDEKEIDSVFFETPYYLEPDKAGGRAYALLREALHETGMVGVALFVMRSKETLAILRAKEEVIVLNRIRFAEEIRDYKDLNLPERKEVKGSELKMAISLIQSLTDEFDITKYRDTYAEELMKVIKAKAGGKRVTKPKLKVSHSKADSLMDQLKASLGQTKKTS